MRERVLCPICRKRLFDLSFSGNVEVEIKCIQCKNVVRIAKGTVTKQLNIKNTERSVP